MHIITCKVPKCNRKIAPGWNFCEFHKGIYVMMEKLRTELDPFHGVSEKFVQPISAVKKI